MFGIPGDKGKSRPGKFDFIMLYIFNYSLLTSKLQPGQDALLLSIVDKQIMQTLRYSQVSRFIISSRDLVRHFASVL